MVQAIEQNDQPWFEANVNGSDPGGLQSQRGLDLSRRRHADRYSTNNTNTTPPPLPIPPEAFGNFSPKNLSLIFL